MDAVGDARGPLLLYDGSCGVCARSVRFVLTHERTSGSPELLRFATLEGKLGRALRTRHPDLADVDSVIWLDASGTPLSRSDAVLAVLRYVGGFWRAAAFLGDLLPRGLRDWAYDWVARNRYTVAGRDVSCLVPTAEQRVRFIG